MTSRTRHRLVMVPLFFAVMAATSGTLMLTDGGPLPFAEPTGESTVSAEPSTPPTSAATEGGATPSAEPTTPVAPEVTPRDPSWNLVWSDEFDGRSVDTSKWTVLDNSTYGDGNNELACLMNRPENVKVTDGLLVITALREETPITCEKGSQRDFTSGHLNTKKTKGFTYGRFELSAKVPMTPGTSKGLWPAFWMRPVEGTLGEIDILEQIGTSPDDLARANEISQTLWYDYADTYPRLFNTFQPTWANLSDGFHTYAFEWEPGVMRWYIDDVLTFTVTEQDAPWLTDAFSQDFYLRLNLAVGGNWPGAPTADTVFPATYEIDYVRVYQR